MRHRVYVSGPLSSSGDREQNVRRAMQAGLDLINAGFAPLVPHLTHFMDGTDSLGHDTWLDVDLQWVRAADAVLRLPGESKGADIEVWHANDVSIPVYHSVVALIQARASGLLPYRWPYLESKPGSPRFHELLREIGDLHAKKSADYGTDEDPFMNIRQSTQWGVDAFTGALVRLGDKVKRLQAFAQKGTLANEGVEDSLRDLASYALIALIMFEEQHEPCKAA